MAGTPVPRSTGVLRDEEKRGTVALQRRRVTILDAQELDRLCRWSA